MPVRGLSKWIRSLNIGKSPDYTGFGPDGTMEAFGAATTWDDLNGSALELKVLGSGLSANTAENTLDFTTGARITDYAYDNYQIRHAWKPGSIVHPHIHFEQAQANMPNFLIQYRWQRNGQSKTTAWTNFKCNSPAFTYVSGTLNQIAFDGGITPPSGYSLSDVLELRIIRDNLNTSTVFAGADPYTATVGITFVDIHIESNTLGSKEEYVK